MKPKRTDTVAQQVRQEMGRKLKAANLKIAGLLAEKATLQAEIDELLGCDAAQAAARAKAAQKRAEEAERRSNDLAAEVAGLRAGAHETRARRKAEMAEQAAVLEGTRKALKKAKAKAEKPAVVKVDEREIRKLRRRLAEAKDENAALADQAKTANATAARAMDTAERVDRDFRAFRGRMAAQELYPIFHGHRRIPSGVALKVVEFNRAELPVTLTTDVEGAPDIHVHEEDLMSYPNARGVQVWNRYRRKTAEPQS